MLESTEIAQAYSELSQAEAQAEALEKMLENLESKMDSILAATQESCPEQSFATLENVLPE